MMSSAGIKSTPITLFNAKRDLSSGCEFHAGQTGSMPLRNSATLGSRTKRAKSCDLISKWKPCCNDFCSYAFQLWSEPSRSEGSSMAFVLFSLNGSKRKRSVSYKAIAASSASTDPLKNLDQEMISCLYTPKHLPRRVITITVAGTADSGQTFPSQNEDEETAVDCARGEERAIPRKPNPEIEPAEVVRAQLQALREKDLTTVFEFASPKNKAHTGPLSRFTEMIQGRAYNVMLGHASADILSSLSICNQRFQQRILIKDANGNQSIFSWSLSRQENDPFQGCWMTDSVHRDE